MQNNPAKASISMGHACSRRRWVKAALGLVAISCRPEEQQPAAQSPAPPQIDSTSSRQARETLNLFVGPNAGSAVTPNVTLRNVPGYGNRNTGLGAHALEKNGVGVNNTAVGALALYQNTGSFDGGNDNTAVGHKALWANAPSSKEDGGINNVAVGAEAAMKNTTGRNNVALGCDALHENVIGESNTAVGHSAMLNSRTTYNTAVGSLALHSQTTGERNTATGVNALFACVSGRYNAAFGMGALNGLTTADNNAACGYFAGYENSTGAENTYIGAESGRSSKPANANVSGSRNVFVGYQSGPGVAAEISGAIGIGCRAMPAASNSAVIGGTGKDAVTLGVGTSVTEGARPGDDIRPRGAAYRVVDATGLATTPLISGSDRGVTTVSGEPVRVANGAVARIAPETAAGILFVVDTTSFEVGQLVLTGRACNTRIVGDSDMFTSVRNTAGAANVYHDGEGYVIQNRLGSDRAFRFVLVGA